MDVRKYENNDRFTLMHAAKKSLSQRRYLDGVVLDKLTYQAPQGDMKPDLDLCSQEYLQRYYNLQEEPAGRAKRSGPSFASKVKDMQMFFGLNATGVLDPNTRETMRSPRCGVPDVEEYSDIQGTRWHKNVISYRYLISNDAVALLCCESEVELLFLKRM